MTFYTDEEREEKQFFDRPDQGHVKERWELIEEMVIEILGDPEEVIELVHSTNTAGDLSSFLLGDTDAIWAFQKRIKAAAKALAERKV